MKVRDIAHSRTGDKGNISNISVIARDPADFEYLHHYLTGKVVKAHFDNLITGTVERYALPQLGALNFVLHGALGGGVTRSLALDAHGKSLSSYLLDIDLPDTAPESPRISDPTR